MSRDKRIDSYIKSRPDWQQNIMLSLRQAVHAASDEIEETIKWGSPWFGYRGTQVAWMFGAAKWVHFSLSQGALLDHSHGLFVQTDNKAMRTIKFTKDSEVPAKLITQLISESKELVDQGKNIKFFRPKPGLKKFDVPDAYEKLLKEAGRWQDYKSRPYYQQKGWIQWIEQAKQESTRQKRIKQMLIELKNGTYMPPKKN
jgi:uncharacterized protein YdeI (YjbR/CyaY-like superfamily)